MFIAKKYVYAIKNLGDSILVYRFSNEDERANYILNADNQFQAVDERNQYVQEAIASKLLWPVTIPLKGG